MNEEELKKVTVKERLDKARFHLIRGSVGVGLVVLGGVVGPLVEGDQAMLMVTAPIAGAYLTYMGVSIKRYLDKKKEWESEERDKGMSL